MKKKIFTRPVTVTLPDEVFKHIKAITDQGYISFSDYIREAIQEKLAKENPTEKENKSERLCNAAAIITPATIYVKVVISAKAGIQNELGWMPDQVRHDIISVLLPEQ